MNNITYKHLNWSDIDDLCEDLWFNMKYKNYEPNCIIGLMKGGVIPARILADIFDIPKHFYALNVSLYTGINSTREAVQIQMFNHCIENLDVLIVDDIWDSGQTMQAVVKYLSLIDAQPKTLTTATLIYKPNTNGEPNYSALTVPKEEWVVYPWERFDFIKEQRKLEGVQYEI